MKDAFIYCAFVQLSDPVTLTATSEYQIHIGLPSALPRRSVEMSSGPAFFGRPRLRGEEPASWPHRGGKQNTRRDHPWRHKAPTSRRGCNRRLLRDTSLPSARLNRYSPAGYTYLGRSRWGWCPNTPSTETEACSYRNCSGVACNLATATATTAAGSVCPSAMAFSMRRALTPSRSETRLDILRCASSSKASNRFCSCTRLRVA